MAIVTGADFRATRERYGLTVQWVADALRVRERTVHRWEAGTVLIPDGITDELAAWHGAYADAVTEYNDHAEAGGPVLVPRLDADSVDNFPAAFHRAAALEAVMTCGRGALPAHLDYPPKMVNPDGEQ